MSRRVTLLVGLCVAIGLVAACSDSKGAKRALEAQGYTHVETTGHSFFGCDDTDTFSTGFHAQGANGMAVSGSVCRKWLHGSVVRVE